nr:peptidoglycan-binding domain-containing protein [uncultured Flavobacterium sp.]
MGDFKGFKNLMNKSLSIAVAALSSMQSINAKDFKFSNNIVDDNHSFSVKTKKLKPQLVLKLNVVNPEDGHMLSLHSSHSSHRSHSSHSSHSSHYSSSYSSGSSSGNYTAPASTYTPSTTSSASSTRTTSTSPSTSASSVVPIKKSNRSSYDTNTIYESNYENTSKTKIALGNRELYKGCQGSDVEELQRLLLQLGYDIIVSEYFGEKTEIAVMKFQKSNELKPDGRVGEKTLLMIKIKS